MYQTFKSKGTILSNELIEINDYAQLAILLLVLTHRIQMMTSIIANSFLNQTIQNYKVRKITATSIF